MPYQIEVSIRTFEDVGERDKRIWRAMRPMGGAPYQFKTLAEAKEVFRLVRDASHPEFYRIVEV